MGLVRKIWEYAGKLAKAKKLKKSIR